MKTTLSVTWELTTERPESKNGVPVLWNPFTERAYQPNDIVTMYVSYGLRTAADGVRRLVERADLTGDAATLVDRFCGPDHET